LKFWIEEFLKSEWKAGLDSITEQVKRREELIPVLLGLMQIDQGSIGLGLQK